ncbi:uncharacterized protein V6R79_024363 [Siganus canaliculatus]
MRHLQQGGHVTFEGRIDSLSALKRIKTFSSICTMKLVKLVSFLRPVMAVLLPLFLIGWTQQAAARPHTRLSPPLENMDTVLTAKEVSRHAQSQDNDSSLRLMPRVNSSEAQDHLTVCCLYGHILDFYLNYILSQHDETYHPQMPRLRVDLNRVRSDLNTQGCNVTHYHDHRHIVEFRRKHDSIDGEQRKHKAIGEIDILFSNLRSHCWGHVKEHVFTLVNLLRAFYRWFQTLNSCSVVVVVQSGKSAVDQKKQTVRFLWVEHQLAWKTHVFRRRFW